MRLAAARGPRRGGPLLANGSADPAFGARGVARVAVPGGVFGRLHTLRLPDGRLLAAGTSTAEDRYQLAQLALVRLTPEGTPDPSFGDGASPVRVSSSSSSAPAAHPIG